jgi:hypothetical protein
MGSNTHLDSGKCFRDAMPAGPSHRMGFAWWRDGTQAAWADVPTPSIMGCDLIPLCTEVS